METERLRPTVTQREQWEVEAKVSDIYQLFSSVPHHAQTIMSELRRDKHLDFVTKGLGRLGPSYCVLDANRPWLCYWILHSIALLGDSVDSELENNSIDFLNRCQDPCGGYAGGPGQIPHLATTYGAVNSLLTLGGQRALSSINRDNMRTFMLRMKQPSGAFRMHDAGEIDVRACYTAISVASVLKILDYELVQNVGDYILSCQTYEGGIAGEPGSEAHGGYTFCGLAAMILINESDRLDLPSLINWVAFRQGVECGFQGRANKLVDGCYSFWQGGVFALIRRLHSLIDQQLRPSEVGEGNLTSGNIKTAASSTLSKQVCGLELTSSDDDETSHFGGGELSDIGYYFVKGRAELEPLFHSIALQQYILLCSQVQEGGFRDKPGKHRDYYHTCYCLCGLSVCQYSWSKLADSSPLPRSLFGPYSNLLEPIHPLYNIVLDKYEEAHDFFSRS
ncbi:protein farnesyltransferase subunit beta isoform X2 [Macadamia integrifolia]|uniref:protein farnesyltransferase subunit beta isoform X2 n=1 Tax=Macadamia integrifolia TaxID=60698 RepID=UPI001C4FCBFF|nr:protein farnesyltransferase subunit beta isoform X2 [Macadamia integrifolia]